MRPFPQMRTLATAIVTATALASGAPRAQEPATVPLRGQVVTWQGEPVAGAAIAFGAEDEWTTAQLLAGPPLRTDTEGRFTVAVPARPESPPARLFVAAEGMAAIAPNVRWQYADTAPPRQRAATDMGRITLPLGTRLFGRVRDVDGRPVAGAVVVARDMLDGHRLLRGPVVGTLCRAVTDRSGIFQLPAALPNAVVLDVSHPGSYRQTLEPVAAATPLEITLVPSGRIAGRVLDAAGSGIAGAMVRALYERSGPTTTATTAADGSFALPLEYRARYRLRATLAADPDAVPPAPAANSHSALLEGPRANLELTLTAGEAAEAPERLAIRAVAAGDRTPVADFRAVAVWEDYANRNANYLEYRLSYHMQRSGVAAKGGAAEVPGPGPNGAAVGAVRVLAPGRAPFTRTDVAWSEVEPGRAREPLVVELEPEATLGGTVVDERSGEPLAGATLWARPALDPRLGVYDRSNAPPEDAVTAAADGSFTLRQLGAGSWHVRVRHPGRPPMPAVTVALERAEQRAGFELRMPAGATVAGRIVGMPIPQGSGVFLHELPRLSFGGTSHVRMVGAGPPAEPTLLDPDGRFEFEGVALESFVLVLVLPSPPRCGQSLHVPIEPMRVRREGIRRDFDVAVDVPGRLAGQVTFARAAVPFERLVVVAQEVTDAGTHTIVQPQGNLTGPRTFVAPDGRFELPVSPGTHRLLLVDLLTSVVLAESPAGVTAKPGTTATADLPAELAQVRVRLVPENEGGAMAVVDRLEVRFQPADSPAAPGLIVMNENYDQGVGLPVPDGTTELVFVLPAGRATLLARSAVPQLRGDGPRWEPGPLGRAELEIAAGAADDAAVEVPVVAPPEVPAEGKAGADEDADGKDR